MRKDLIQAQRSARTAFRVIQASVDDYEETFVDGDDDCDETMTWFTTDVEFYWDKTLPKTTTDYPNGWVASTSWYDR